MYRVTREIHFCYGHRLLNYEGKCRHLHGHNGRALITLQGAELDERGMLVDFGEIKRQIQRWIDENLDHNMLLCRDDPLLPLLRERGERVFVMEATRRRRTSPGSSMTELGTPACPSSKLCSGRPRTVSPRSARVVNRALAA